MFSSMDPGQESEDYHNTTTASSYEALLPEEARSHYNQVASCVHEYCSLAAKICKICTFLLAIDQALKQGFSLALAIL